MGVPWPLPTTRAINTTIDFPYSTYYVNSMEVGISQYDTDLWCPGSLFKSICDIDKGK